MEILAHRGLWNSISDKNSIVSLCYAFESGFGIETDIRDYNGKIVISHDIPTSKSPDLEVFFKMVNEKRYQNTMALNIKSDGLQIELKKLLKKYNINNYFVFDMSVPEEVVYRRDGIKYFTRHSDVERMCVLYKDCFGVWMDSFFDECWLSEEKIKTHIKNGKKIGIISPEIHGYKNDRVWDLIKKLSYDYGDSIMLCTDCCNEAKEFFGHD